MPNYQNGKIYSLRSYQTDDIYIGSTTQSLALRKGGHQRDYKRYSNGKYHFVTSFNIIKFDDCYIELIEKYSCNSKNELEKREGELIRERDCVNKIVVGRTPKEYKKKYRDENKQKISEKNKQKYTCECGSVFRKSDKSRHEKSKKHQKYKKI